jgi:hypothetical protein
MIHPPGAFLGQRPRQDRMEDRHRKDDQHKARVCISNSKLEDATVEHTGCDRALLPATAATARDRPTDTDGLNMKQEVWWETKHMGLAA